MTERFETFTVLLNKISRNVKKIKNQELAEYGLRSAHVSCIYYLYAANSLTATELCERCEEDKATISRALDVLEEKGFIVCQSQATKRYKSLWNLTEKGQKAGQKVFNAVERVLEKVSAGLSDDHRKMFYSYLRIVSDNLEKITDTLA